MTPRKAAAALILLSCLAPVAHAEEPSYRRVLLCQNENARMEVYLPQSAVSGSSVDNANIAKPVLRPYALDLSGANKGKALEPLRLVVRSP